MKKQVKVSYRKNYDIEKRKSVLVRKNKNTSIEFGIKGKTVFIRFTESISSSNPIVITKKDSKVLFQNLNWFMDQEYKGIEQDENRHYKDDNHFVWVSDVESYRKDPGTPRLVIDRTEDAILVSKRIPIVEQTGERNAGGMVVFDTRKSIEEYHDGKTIESVKPDFFHAINCTACKCRIYRPKTEQKRG